MTVFFEDINEKIADHTTKQLHCSQQIVSFTYYYKDL